VLFYLETQRASTPVGPRNVSPVSPVISSIASGSYAEGEYFLYYCPYFGVQVIEFSANREPLYDFLLVIIGNLGLPLPRYSDLLPENHKFLPTLLLFSYLWESFAVTETKSLAGSQQ